MQVKGSRLLDEHVVLVDATSVQMSWALQETVRSVDNRLTHQERLQDYGGHDSDRTRKTQALRRRDWNNQS